MHISSKLMNKYHHYDWGLRSIRTVLTECGRTLKSHKLENKNVAENEEADIVLQVLKDDTLPKLSYLDSIKFNSLLETIFEKVTVPNIGTDVISKFIEESFDELGLIKNDRQVRNEISIEACK